MRKILFVANVAKEHILKFHVPTIKKFKDEGWIVDVACAGEEDVPYCDHQFKTSWKRSPFTPKTFKGILELRKIIDEGNYDVVYCHTPVGGLVARLAGNRARKTGTKMIYCAHGLHFFKGAPLRNWLIYYPMEYILSFMTDVIYTVNRADYKILVDKFPKQVQKCLVPEVGVNMERLEVRNKQQAREKIRTELNIPFDAKVLIYVAELIPNKNQIMLIDMLQKVRAKFDNTYLVLVGPDHFGGKYQNEVERRSLSKYVRFTGWRSDIGELMVSADICTASSIREGFGINLVEAMYCGLPVVATNNRGHEMVIEDGVNGFLVDVGDISAMADRIISLLSDDELRNRLGSIDVSRYDCKTIAEKLYDHILNNSTGEANEKS